MCPRDHVTNISVGATRRVALVEIAPDMQGDPPGRPYMPFLWISLSSTLHFGIMILEAR